MSELVSFLDPGEMPEARASYAIEYEAIRQELMKRPGEWAQIGEGYAEVSRRTGALRKTSPEGNRTFVIEACMRTDRRDHITRGFARAVRIDEHE